MPPRILPRSEHTLSRKNVDPDALRVLYRLKTRGFIAYLVGGGVRDLLLGRKPKDFDVGTSAHPQQVKKLFRNCFIVGRRFRLCHVRFDKKVVEVSTFRRQAPEAADGDGLIRRDNTFGTPEEDAFRRDFTVNALFYDIASFAIIDYVGGLEDLDARLIRTIGDPVVRLREDPVRMLRAVALAARLGFTIDRETLEAVRTLRGEIVRSSPVRLIEEIYKILRQGAARATFLLLHELGLLAYLIPAADQALSQGGERLLAALGRLDDHRNTGGAAPEELSNAFLAGTLLVPLGLPLRAARPAPEFPDRRERPIDLSAELAELEAEGEGEAEDEDVVTLPFARRDLDRLRLVLAAQPKLREVQRSPRVKHLLAGRHYFADALRWLEVHGGVEGQELAAYWRGLDFADVPPQEGRPEADPSLPADDADERPAPGVEDGETRAAGRTRRRRRRGRRGRGPENTPGSQQAATEGGDSPADSPTDAAGTARRRRRRRRRSTRENGSGPAEGGAA